MSALNALLQGKPKQAAQTVGRFLLNSTLGIGGSLVVVPALLLVLPLLHIPEDLTPTMALGTSLTVSLATAVFSAWQHWRHKNLNDPFSTDKLALMLCAGLGAVAGAAMVNSVRPAIALGVIAGAQLYFGVGILRPRPKAHQASVDAFNSRATSSRLFFGVVGLLTGAAGIGGFKGLAGRFSRRELLSFGAELPGEIRFTRQDNGQSLCASLHLGQVPADSRLAPLLQALLAGKGDAEQAALFAELWQDRVRRILIEHFSDPGLVRLS